MTRIGTASRTGEGRGARVGTAEKWPELEEGLRRLRRLRYLEPLVTYDPLGYVCLILFDDRRSLIASLELLFLYLRRPKTWKDQRTSFHWAANPEKSKVGFCRLEH